ncbi:MAG: NAD(P)H-binding protein [Chitinophagaceae bacterium]|nr:NAD(P)H-binding protein [Chitinophagaceae bacterium]
MRLTVFGATGMVGRRIVAQALAGGDEVIAFGRNVESLIDKDNRSDQLTAFKGYVFSESDVLQAIEGSDAVVSALGGAIDGTDRSRSLGIKNIIRQMELKGLKRIVALGGIGVLNASDDHYLLDTPGYPAALRAVGQEHMLAYLFLQGSSLDWSFVCPPTIVDEEGSRNYITSADYPPQQGGNEVMAGDLADFMLRELKNDQYLHHRIGIASR